MPAFLCVISVLLAASWSVDSRHISCHDVGRRESDSQGSSDLQVPNGTFRHESFFMMSAYRTSSDVTTPSRDSRTTKLLGDDTCDVTSQPSAQDEGVAVSCPWHYVLSTDPERQPESVVEAVCNCHERACLGGPPESRCLPVQYYIRVNRLVTNSDGDTYYEPRVEPITVGCTCAVPSDFERIQL